MSNDQCPMGGWPSRAAGESRRSNLAGNSLVIGIWSFLGHWSLVIGHFSSVRFVLYGTAFAVLSAGCAGYHLGSTNGVRAGERSVQVNPFVNQTIEPRLS